VSAPSVRGTLRASSLPPSCNDIMQCAISCATFHSISHVLGRVLSSNLRGMSCNISALDRSHTEAGVGWLAYVLTKVLHASPNEKFVGTSQDKLGQA
jgi:hypothetical protein